MNVYLGQHTVSDMLGPCEDGFHVPLKTEWQAIIDAGVSLGAWTSSGGSNFGRYLKLPMAGFRNGNSVDNIGSYGQYWGADIFSSVVDTITILYFTSSSITNGYSTPKFGYSIRPIKDSPVTPTSGWTTIVGTLGSSGIFWNQTDGLISISSNGSTWYTISDKNVGATTVWNYGDALTEANCGSTFQRGNNYAFPSTKSTASVTTSSTQVDVTGYGPGNYYESSTWITASTWQSSNNANLRGGQTKGTWLKDTMLKNAYIGEVWKPGANTLAYRPLTSDLNDYSGNNHNFSAASGTYSFSNNMCTLQRATISGFSLANYSGDFTLSMRTTNGGPNCWFMPVIYSDGYPSMQLYWTGDIAFYMKFNGSRYGLQYTSYPGTGIHLITGTKTSTQITLYIDGQEYNHITGTYGQLDGANNTWLGRNVNGSGTITAGDAIIENKARTAKEVLNYYNNTKSNYGL